MATLSLINYFELGAFLLSLIAYRNLRGTPLNAFPLFLGFIVLAELLGKNAWIRLPATGIYIIAATAGFVFYAFIFSRHLKGSIFKKIAAGFMIVYPVLTLLDGWLGQGLSRQHPYTLLLGSLTMIAFCCRFFYELLQNPFEAKPGRNPMFWISTGILFFYLSDLSYNLLSHLLDAFAAGEGRKVFQSINNNLILILYSCFIIAFLCKRNLRRSLQP
jgi:hypothetical protein